LQLTGAGAERERSDTVVGMGERREKPEIERYIVMGVGMSELLEGVHC
jgi:hypothetical protein